MHAAPTDHLDDVVVALAAGDDLLADFDADFVDDAEDVALPGRGVWPNYKVRAAQGVEVNGVVGDVEGAVEHLAQLLDRRRRLYAVEHVQRLGSGHVVRLGADAADAVGDARHLFGRAADAELLEAAQFGDLEVGIGHVARFVEEDLDFAVPFQPGDGVDGNAGHDAPPWPLPRPLPRARCSSEWAMLKR